MWFYQPIPLPSAAGGGFVAAWAVNDDDIPRAMKKNVASQVVGCQLVSATDGSAFTGAVTVSVTGDAGTQATGSVGSGACAHEGNGYHTYAPAQAETNYDQIGFTFTGTGAIPRTLTVYTTFPQTGDNFARLGAPAGASMSADIAAVKGVLPSALTADGNIKADALRVGGTTQTGRDLGASVLLSSGTGTGQVALSSGAVTVGTNNDKTGYGLADGAITTNKFADGAMTAAKFASGAFDAVWSVATRLLTAGTNIVLAKGTGVTGFNDLDASGVRSAVGLGSANLDTQFGDLPTAAENAAAVWGAGSRTLTAIDEDSTTLDLDATIRAALGMAAADLDDQLDAILAASGGSAPTAEEIAAAVWDEAIAGHLDAGSTGNALNNATAAGNPWEAIIIGSYTAEDLLKIIAAYAAGTTDWVRTGGGPQGSPTSEATATFRHVDNSGDAIEADMVGSKRVAVTLTP